MNIFVFGEHPEDLGAVIREEDKLLLIPASIWQFPELRGLVLPSSSLQTVAINQCCWGALGENPQGWFPPPNSFSHGVPMSGPCSIPMDFMKDPWKNMHVSARPQLRRSNPEAFRTTLTFIHLPWTVP